MELLTTSEAAKKWGISRKCVSLLCAEGRIEGVIFKGKRAASMPAVNFETVENYLYMEQERFGDDFTILYETEDSDFNLPVFSVQTMVEKAVCHGVRESRPERGRCE